RAATLWARGKPIGEQGFPASRWQSRRARRVGPLTVAELSDKLPSGIVSPITTSSADQDRSRRPAVSHEQVSEPVSARAPAFRAFDPQHVELADQVAEDDRPVAEQTSVFSDYHWANTATNRPNPSNPLPRMSDWD